LLIWVDHSAADKAGAGAGAARPEVTGRAGEGGVRVAGSGVDIYMGICMMIVGGMSPSGRGVGNGTSVSIVEAVKGAVRGGAVRGTARGIDAMGTSSSSLSDYTSSR